MRPGFAAGRHSLDTKSRPLYDSETLPRCSPSVFEESHGLVLHRDGIWVRPQTYDKQIVIESRQYLLLDPGKDDVLLDIGANIGATSLRFLAAGVRQVIAVEPESENYRILRQNLSGYSDRSLSIRAAVASGGGVRRLWLNRGRNKGMHSLVQQRKRHPVPVPTVSLEPLLLEHRPTLVKIDIEGGEYEIAASLAALPVSVRGLALELHLRLDAWRYDEAPALLREIRGQGFRELRPPRLGSNNPC